MKNIIKKPIVAALAVLAIISMIPASFSWYTHNSVQVPNGNKINFIDSTLPVSLSSASGAITMHTVIVDKDGNTLTDDQLTQVNANSVKHYKTTFTNTGNNDLMVDFNLSNLGNSSDYFIGSESPTLNEKCYASRASREKATGESVRIYFKSHRNLYPYWTAYEPTPVTADDYTTFKTGLTNDMNVAYKLTTDDTVHYKKLTICNNFSSYEDYLAPSYNSVANNKATVQSKIDTAVFYADLPVNTEYFFFFDHYYDKDAKNKNWNSTIHITDLSQGKMYVMTGERDGNEYKEYRAEATDTNLTAVIQYYSDVRMSLGSNVTASIGLKKTGDDEDFVPEYYGTEITYTVDNRSGVDTENLITVNRDGLIIPSTNTLSDSERTSRVKTTVRGKYGDTKVIYTIVSIPPAIAQVPIIKNIKVAKSGSTTFDGKPANVVDVYWYIKNKSASAMTGFNIFYTI